MTTTESSTKIVLVSRIRRVIAGTVSPESFVESQEPMMEGQMNEKPTNWKQVIEIWKSWRLSH
jgi:hypothetical protein